MTEAARRALARAGVFAVTSGSTAREPVHLLWAIALDDSEGAETLKRVGVGPEDLESVCALPLPAEVLIGMGSPWDADANPGRDYEDSAELRRVISLAAQAATAHGRQPEVGTGDLLWALGMVDSAASRALQDLEIQLPYPDAERGDAMTDPLAIDFRIDWGDSTAADQTATLRILDAAANRAREGLRVLEDYARFALDDAHLTKRLKECRHALREALAGLPSEALLRSRDTDRDVGTSISTSAESVRQSPAEVAHAGFKRAQEAIRSLEEFGKILSTTAAAKLERLRYELYTLEKGLALTEFNRREFDGRDLYLLATESLCATGLGPAVRSALAGGVDVVQLREKEMPERRLIDLGRRVREWTRDADALFIMNDRADLAVVTDADGVHVGQDELRVKEARAIVGPRRLVGVSTHTIEQARQAVLDGADYLGVGPVFPSATKSFDLLAGLDFVRQVAAEISLPWFAIGGINAENVASVVEAGARRIAVSHAILGAEDPSTAARLLREQLSH